MKTRNLVSHGLAAKILFSTLLLALALAPNVGGAASWVNTGSLNIPRSYHTATLLPNGKVLVAGGQTNLNGLVSAEWYDPAAGTWRNTGSLGTARGRHTATLLTNGLVLVAGGNPTTASSELFNPATGTWSPTANTLFNAR